MKQTEIAADKYEKEDLQTALKVLREGGVILYPTDTVWGIGCDATNEEAVKRIYSIKRRADNKAMLVLIDAPGRLRTYVEDIPETAWTLLENTGLSAEERPLTIIYPRARQLAPSLTGDDGSIGIRITAEPFSHALCAGLGKPVVSTSANISGEATAKTFTSISPEIINAVDYVCRFRRNDNRPHKPSAVIKVNEDNSFEIIRK
ncbi:MAG: threonylcarbamoyl-AMP synthase [Paludibacteraceae bacterium]|nr:threonylcarbamoyl-AMP synthase [Paludibacteraceae bacterium]